LEAVLRQMQAGVFIAEAPSGRLLFANEPGVQIYGHEYMHAETVADYRQYHGFHPDGRPLQPEEWPMARAIATCWPVLDVEIEVVGGDGVHRNVLHSATPILDDDGQVSAAVVVLHDITAHRTMERALRQARDELEQRVEERTAELQAEIAVRRETEASLRESEMRFRQMAEHIGETFFLFEPETRRLIYVSPGYEIVWGRPAEEVYRQPSLFFDGIHPADRDRVRAEMETGWLSWDVEFRVVRPDGSLRWVRGRAFPVVSEPGATPRMAGILEDVTLQKEAHEALVRAERLQTAGMLAASLSHEINNPLQAALGALDLGREALADGRPVAPYLEVGHNALRRAAGVMAQMRGLFASEAGESTGTVYLDELVRQAVRTTMVHCEALGVGVVFEPGPDVPCVRTMPTALQQVFLNLLLNAVEATPEGGQVRVGTGHEPERKRVWVRFADTGPGIPPEVLERLFEPFQTTKAGGLGLGLFISRNLVERAGGGIEVESAPGWGTTMSVWLPV
ncbi:MAG TPA: ATP-binding protein, partial [Anaerolineae bacterium]|nr:ATP-binding protein [Anaerolineae bacterium]